jgi:hypothetical protein
MAARTNRRDVLTGALALGLTGIAPARAAEDALLLTLGADLARLRRRCKRLQRDTREPGAVTTVWVRWSEAVDSRALLHEQIVRRRAHGPAGAVIKVQAVAWELLDAGWLPSPGNWTGS